MDKEQAVKDFQERRVEKAKKAFQQKVDEALRDIATVSKQLKEAKRRFSELNYEEPEQVEV